MATNKHATIRYQALDKCFSNWGRRYFIDDLIEACNEALFDYSGIQEGVKRRQVFDDIKFMESEQGFDIELERLKEGKKVYYRYSSRDFSINSSPLNTTEAEYLKNAISLLQRFDGAPGFEWIGELSSILTDQFDLKDANKKVMSYDSNIDYKGYRFITLLFNAIVNRRVLNINYEPFGKPSIQLEFHPYFLKQFNNRWFVFGRNEQLNINQWNLPLDRIVEVKEIDKSYISDTTDWEEFFSDFIGVTKTGNELVEVKLIFSQDQAPYITTKPLHESQKTRLLENGELEVRIEVIPNYELEMQLLSFADNVKIMEPTWLVNGVKKRLMKALNQY